MFLLAFNTWENSLITLNEVNVLTQPLFINVIIQRIRSNQGFIAVAYTVLIFKKIFIKICDRGDERLQSSAIKDCQSVITEVIL